ncbi:MAG: polysaccharide biosynthesis/export family protein [Methylococcales bacterium]|nr:polysaccharide biosynthesis/export family protein [Methylococcales bacterium]
MSHFLKYTFFFLLSFYQASVFADNYTYTVNPGDVLEISVWKEKELQREVRVLPDGHISFPLAGDINASGLSLNELKDNIVKGLSKYISDPVVNIAVKSAEGNMVYVLGQVKQPGQFIMYQPLDVMQVLSLAGGLTTFAKSNDIIIIRRDSAGSKSLPVRYGDLEEGEDLKKNHLLKSGDVIVVP